VKRTLIVSDLLQAGLLNRISAVFISTEHTIMKNMFARIALASILVSNLALAETFSTLEQIKNSETIRIGYRESEPPMSFLDKNNQPVGYSIELCTHIVNGVKSELKNPNIATKYVPVTASNRFDALTDNSIDILCGATTKTLSRAEIVDFTQLTFVTGASLLSLASSGIDTIPELQDGKIAVVRNTTTIESLTKAIKQVGSNATIVPVDSAADGIKAVVSGEVNAFSSDQIVLIGLALTNEKPEQFVISEGVFSFEPFALAVRRNDAEFRLIADRVLSQLNRSGNITPIYLNWFGGYIKEVSPLLEAMYVLNSTPE
jgi:glutamate/aspartate transport system substrate-binding protein